MTECKRISVPHRKLCLGDLNRKIQLKSRNIQPVSVGVDFQQKFENTKSVWSAIKTKDGVDTFGGVNLSNTISHVIYIRWFDGLTAEHWIEYKSKLYDIVDIENIDERDEFYALFCNERGDSSKKANFS